MKCNECEAYVQNESGTYDCLANVPDEEIKSFKDGTCGCKYKSATIKSLMEMAGVSGGIEGQLTLSDFMYQSFAPDLDEYEMPEATPEVEEADSEEEFIEEAPAEDVSIPEESPVEEIIEKPHHHNRNNKFQLGDRVSLSPNGQLYTIKEQSEDQIVVKVTGPTGEIIEMCAADLILAEQA